MNSRKLCSYFIVVDVMAE